MKRQRGALPLLLMVVLVLSGVLVAGCNDGSGADEKGPMEKGKSYSVETAILGGGGCAKGDVTVLESGSGPWVKVRTTSGRGFPATEFWLNMRQVVFVVAK